MHASILRLLTTPGPQTVGHMMTTKMAADENDKVEGGDKAEASVGEGGSSYAMAEDDSFVAANPLSLLLWSSLILSAACFTAKRLGSIIPSLIDVAYIFVSHRHFYATC